MSGFISFNQYSEYMSSNLIKTSFFNFFTEARDFYTNIDASFMDKFLLKSYDEHHFLQNLKKMKIKNDDFYIFEHCIAMVMDHKYFSVYEYYLNEIYDLFVEYRINYEDTAKYLSDDEYSNYGYSPNYDDNEADYDEDDYCEEY